MSDHEIFEKLANTPLRDGTTLDYTGVSAKMSKLSLGTWQLPVFPVSESHRQTIQTILDEPDRTKAYHDLADMYMASDVDFRLTVSMYWNFGAEWGFDKKLPTLQRVRSSLIWYSIAVKDSQDIRDDLMGIAANYHRCAANGLNPDEVFRSVAEVSLPFIAQLLIDFINRPSDSRSMAAFGLIQTVLEDGTIEIGW